MAKIKKDLLVSVADANFLPQVKQLFSSVYQNSGWEGDYMLLSDNISDSDKDWFREKGILLFCPPLLSQLKFGHRSYPPLLFSKLYLFHEYFKKWRSVVFLDSDIIVRASFSALSELPGFNAPLAITIKLKDEFIPDAKKYLPSIYNLNGKAFTTGVFAFNTDIIKKNTLPEMIEMFNKYHELCFFGEEAILNLFFYKKWAEVIELYNYIPWYMKDFYALNDYNFPAPIIHSVCSFKPWEDNHPNKLEWKNNLSKADEIDLNKRLPAKKIWTEGEIRHYILNIKIKRIIFITRVFIKYCDRQVGQIGLFIKRLSPSLYEKIKIKK